MEESFLQFLLLCFNVTFNNLAATVEIVMENTNSGVIKLALTEEQFQGCCKTELKITNGGDACALWHGD